MKLISTVSKAHGINVYTYEHKVKGEKKQIEVTAINEGNAQPKAWKKVSEMYKNQQS